MLIQVSDFVSKAGNNGVRCIELKTEAKGTLHAFFGKSQAIKKEASKRKAEIEKQEGESAQKKIKLEED
jgi:hypothetical protein